MGEGYCITLFSSSDVTEFHRMKYGGGGLIYPSFHRVTSLRFTETLLYNVGPTSKTLRRCCIKVYKCFVFAGSRLFLTNFSSRSKH